MIEHRTRSCGRYGQPEIIVPFTYERGIDPAWLVDFFESETARGRRFVFGDILRVGWMLAVLRETAAGDLDVWEPSFRTFPAELARGVNHTLRHLAWQKAAAAFLGHEPLFPTLLQPAWVSRAFWASQAPSEFVMRRQPPAGNDSGWSFTLPATPCNDEERHSLFEISLRHRGVVPYLALPPCAEVVLAGQKVHLKLRRKLVSSTQDNRLRRLAACPFEQGL